MQGRWAQAAVLFLSALAFNLQAVGFDEPGEPGGGGLVITPGVPTNITVPANDTDGSFSLSWTHSTSRVFPGNYFISLSTNNGTYLPLNMVPNTVNTYSVTGLANGSYRFGIIACNPGNLGEQECGAMGYSGSVLKIERAF